jgi:pimeloyl-ACP methyl ester carboxylesterase
MVAFDRQRIESPPATGARDTLRAVDGVHLAVERFGDSGAAPLIFAHGFGQTRRAWNDTARRLAADGWYCITADARGHGDSGWRDDGLYDFPQFIDDLVELARRSAQAPAPARPILIGASMGGLLGIAAQAAHAAFRALVLVDITPRWESAGVERIIAFMRAHPDGFASLDEAAEAIARYLPHRRERKSPGKLRQMLVRQDNGRLRWHWDPRLLDRIANDSEREQAGLLDAARRIAVPTLLVSGARSDVVSAATIGEFLACVPHARHVRVAQATHMVVGDRNDAFAAAVRDFIEPLRASAAGITRSTS